jgi:hypothetical protein
LHTNFQLFNATLIANKSALYEQIMTDDPAVFFLANDKVLENSIKLLSSMKFHGFNNKIYYIPFNDDMEFTRKAFASYGGECYDVDLDEIDALAHKIYDRDPPAKPYPYCLGKVRKLSFLTYPGPAVYLDSDCVVTSKPELFNDVFRMSMPGIGYINTSPEGVYEDVPAAAQLRSRSTYLTSGMISKSAATISISDIDHLLDEDNIARYLAVRHRGGYVDQPLWNFLVDIGFLPATDLLADRRASRVTSVTAELSLAPDGSVRVGNLPVLLLHLAGPALKNAARYRFLLDGMLMAGLRQFANEDDKEFAAISKFIIARQ